MKVYKYSVIVNRYDEKKISSVMLSETSLYHPVTRTVKQDEYQLLLGVSLRRRERFNDSYPLYTTETGKKRLLHKRAT